MPVQSNFLEAVVADTLLGRSSIYSWPGTLYFALFNSMPDGNGQNGAEVPSANGTGYARVAVTNGTSQWPGLPTTGATKGIKSNLNAITFPAALTAWGDVVGFGIYDAASGGNLLVSSPLDTTRTVAANDTMRFTAGSLQFTEYNPTPDNILSFFGQRFVLDSLFGRSNTYTVPSDVYFSLFTMMPQPDEVGGATSFPGGQEVGGNCTIQGTTTSSGAAITLTGAATNSTATVTCASTAGLASGMQISGSGIPTYTAIVSVTNSTTFVISSAATATASGLTLTANLATGAIVASTAGLVAGMNVTGTGIPTGTTIAAVVTGSSNALVLNSSATANGTPMLTFTNPATGYARVDVPNNSTNFPAYANGVKQNANQIVWPVCAAAWPGVVGIGIHDDPTSGNLLWKIPFASARNFVIGEEPRLAANAVSIYLD